MHLLTLKNHEASTYKIYCGLGNGVLSFLELKERNQVNDLFNVKVCKSPINHIELVQTSRGFNYLWLASNNKVYIMNEK